MDNNNLYGADNSTETNPYDNSVQQTGGQENYYQQAADQNTYQDAGYQQPNQNQYQQAGYYQQSAPAAPQDKASGMAIASMICGILSILCCCAWYISLILAGVAIVLGIVNNTKHMGGKGMAIAGIVTGSVGIVLVVAFLLLMVLGMTSSEFSDILSNYSY